MPALDLVVTGLGVTSSLGVGAVGVGAAVRAGLSGARELDFAVTSGVDADEETVVGHAVPELTVGFRGDARLARLAQLAMVDLAQADGDRPRPDRVAVVAPAREWTPRRRPEPADPAAEEDLELPPPRWDDDRLLATVCRRTGLAGVPGIVVREGPAGFMTALLWSAQSGGVTLIVAVDSLVDPAILGVLHGEGRLKCSGRPDGLQPGEAAVAMRVAPAGTAASGRAHGRILAVGRSVDPRSYVSGETPNGAGIVHAVADLQGPVPVDPAPWTYVDLNGEVYRAVDWGNALVHAHGSAPWMEMSETRCPATSLGDTGSSSAALNTAVAVRELTRAARPGHAAVVVSASDTGERGALVVTGAGT